MPETLAAEPPEALPAERFDHFMARANAAYYATHDFSADFCTAPELTQVFGELLGAWAKTVWQMTGAPETAILAEAGPGRGVLMGDALRAWPGANVHFIETSPRLRAEQQSRVPQATWHDSLATLPKGPMILLANEFLDVLPVRQFIRRETAYVVLPEVYRTVRRRVQTSQQMEQRALARAGFAYQRHLFALLDFQVSML